MSIGERGGLKTHSHHLLKETRCSSRSTEEEKNLSSVFMLKMSLEDRWTYMHAMFCLFKVVLLSGAMPTGDWLVMSSAPFTTKRRSG